MIKIQEVARYEDGTNARLDRINNGKTVWIVQGSLGRRPIIADTADEAREKYRNKKAAVIEEIDTDEAL